MEDAKRMMENIDRLREDTDRLRADTDRLRKEFDQQRIIIDRDSSSNIAIHKLMSNYISECRRLIGLFILGTTV
jgi:hypothetical protein